MFRSIHRIRHDLQETALMAGRDVPSIQKRTKAHRERQMTIMETVSIALIIAGTIIMIASAISSRRAFNIVQEGRYRIRWKVVQYLLVLFIAVYAFALYIVVVRDEAILELVLGITLLSGAIGRYTGVWLVYRSTRESQTILEIGRVTNSSPSIQDVWDDVTELIRAEVPFDRISIGTFDAARNQWIHTYVKGIEIPGWGIGDALPSTGSINTRTVDDIRGQLIRIDLADISPEELRAHKPSIYPGLISVVTVPLLSNNFFVSCLILLPSLPYAFSALFLGVFHRIADLLTGLFQSPFIPATLP